MDLMSQELEFLDFSGLVDKDRNYIQSVLYSRNPNAIYPQLPWQVTETPVNAEVYQQPPAEIPWSHQQQFDAENSGEIVNYENEPCDSAVEKDDGNVEQPVDYPSSSNIMPSLYVIPNYGIMNHMPFNPVPSAQLFSSPSNEMNEAAHQPPRNLNTKMNIKSSQKINARFQQPNVDAVEQVMQHQPPSQNFFYSVPTPQYSPYFPAAPNQLASHQITPAQHAAGSPLYLQHGPLVNAYPQAVYYQPAVFSPPLVNQHAHEQSPLEINQSENLLVKSEFVENVQTITVENSVPYNNNNNNKDNLNEDNSNCSGSVVSNVVNKNDGTDKVNSSEISTNASENLSSTVTVDESKVSCVTPFPCSNDSILSSDAPVNEFTSVPNLMKTASKSPGEATENSNSRSSNLISKTKLQAPSSVISTAIIINSDSGEKLKTVASGHTISKVATKTNSPNTDSSKLKNSVLPPNPEASVSSTICVKSNVNSNPNSSNDNNHHNSVKSVCKGKETSSSASSFNSASKLESKPVAPVLSSAAHSSPVTESRINWAAIVAGNTNKTPSYAAHSHPSNIADTVSHVDPSVTSSTSKTVKAESTFATKPKAVHKTMQHHPPKTSPRNQSVTSMKQPVNEPLSAVNDACLLRIGELLSSYKLDYKVVNLLPRGLNNRSNYCYINATLQALLACSPFYNLLKAISSILDKNERKNLKSSLPFISGLITFVDEFSHLPDNITPRKQKPFPPTAQKYNKNQAVDSDLKTEAAFEPSFIYKILASLTNDSGASFNVEGRQEDAEEFLSCLLNGINDEMLELMKRCEDPKKKSNLSNGDITINGDTAETGDYGAEWQHVKGKKSAIVRDTNIERTPLSDIFRGKLKSQVKRAVGCNSSNVQPFFTLQLDIEKAESVTEAFGMLVDRDQLEGVTCSRTNKEVEAWQYMTLEELPCVLLLHLKCFDFKQQVQSCGKIIKTIDFPINLELDNKWMSYRKTQNRKYKLFAVVYHEGKEANKGHYIADVYHHGYESWIRYDDSTVFFIDESVVLKPKPPRVPYLLYYRRVDTLRLSPVGTKPHSTPAMKNR